MPDFPKTAFILGAGLGTRLRPLTEHCPKPLLPLGGKPMVERALAKLYAAGTRRFLINTHHCPEAWTQAFPTGRWQDAEIRFVHEPVLLETGGGLANINQFLTAEDTQLVVWNGDILSDVQLAEAYAHHITNGAEATLVVREKGPNTNVRITDDGFVTDLRDRLGKSDLLASASSRARSSRACHRRASRSLSTSSPASKPRQAQCRGTSTPPPIGMTWAPW